LKPEDLNDRFDDLDAYLKDIHAIDEDFVDEDEGAFDDYLNQLDADIAKEKVELPSVPADIPKTSVESKTKSGEQKQERRAVMECDCLLNDIIEWVLSSAIHRICRRSCSRMRSFSMKWSSIFIIRPISQRRFQRSITH
jgi:hypothetical protein